MEAADETRKHWASLLAGAGSFPQAPLGTWLGMAAQALGAVSPMPQGGATGQIGQAGQAEVPDWTAALGPMMKAWTTGFDSLQGSPWASFSTTAANPVARLMSHPAAVGGGEQSQSRLSANAATALLDFMQAATAHQALQAKGWGQALQRFTAEFMPGAASGAGRVSIESLDGLLGHWSVVGESAMQESMRTEAFLESQAEVLRKSMQYRIARRTAMEAAARENDLPTLTDLDEAFAAIHALRRELREVRQLAQAALTASSATQVPASEPARARGGKAAPSKKAPAATGRAATAKASGRTRRQRSAE